MIRTICTIISCVGILILAWYLCFGSNLMAVAILAVIAASEAAGEYFPRKPITPPAPPKRCWAYTISVFVGGDTEHRRGGTITTSKVGANLCYEIMDLHIEQLKNGQGVTVARDNIIFLCLSDVTGGES